MFHIVRKFEDLRGAYADGQLDGASVRSLLPYIVCISLPVVPVLCLCLCLCLWLSVCLSVCVSACLSICLCICLSVCRSVGVFVRLVCLASVPVCDVFVSWTDESIELDLTRLD